MSAAASKNVRAPTEITGNDTLSELRCFTDTHGVITSTMNEIPGYRVKKVLGAVYGLSVRSRNWGADIASVLKSVVGGELSMLTKMLYSGRNQAVDRMIGETLGRGGNAVCAYGTACLVERIDEDEVEEAAELKTAQPTEK